jgi:hypothetical protein
MTLHTLYDMAYCTDNVKMRSGTRQYSLNKKLVSRMQARMVQSCSKLLMAVQGQNVRYTRS